MLLQISGTQILRLANHTAVMQTKLICNKCTKFHVVPYQCDYSAYRLITETYYVNDTVVGGCYLKE